MFKKLALLVVASGFLLSAKADTFVASSAANTTNDSVTQGLVNAGPTQNIAPNPAWAPALPGSNWISYAITGDPSAPGYYVVAPDGTSVTFTQIFNLSGPITGGTLSVMADDTTNVVLNGTTIFSAALGGSYPTCSTVPVGCLTSTAATIDLTPYIGLLNQGSNTLAFTVYQENASSFGLDYAGTISTPEPGMFALLAFALGGLLLFVRRNGAADFVS
jgi:hypothetical protein